MLETRFTFFISKKKKQKQKQKQKTGEIPIFVTVTEKVNFGLHFAGNRHFHVAHALLRHCDVIR